MKKSLRTIVCAAVLVGVMIIGIACTTSQKAKVANDENASKSVKIAVFKANMIVIGLAGQIFCYFS